MQNTTDDTDNQAELTPDVRQALKDAEDALIAAGIDPTAYLTAARRHTEAIRNMMLVEVVPSFERSIQGMLDKGGATSLSEQVGALAQSVGTLVQQQKAGEADNQSRISYFYQQMGAFLSDADTRFDRHFATVEEAVALAGKAYALAESVAAGQAELSGTVNDLGEQVSAMDARLVLVEATPGTNPDLTQKVEYLGTKITIVGYAVALLILLWMLILIATVIR